MRTFFLLFLLTSLGVTVRAQCDFVGVSVSASDTALISLYHPGFFFFGATDNLGGYDNVCYWTIYDMDGAILHEAETSGDWGDQSFFLFEPGVPVTDSMRVEIVLTSPLEDYDCCVSDTLLWSETESPIGDNVWGDWSVETDGYTVGVECGGATAVVESEPTAAFSAYPNPSSGDVTIRWSGSEVAQEAILRDVQGREAKRFQNVANGHVLHLNVAPGFYTLVLKTAKGFSTQKLQVLD